MYQIIFKKDDRKSKFFIHGESVNHLSLLRDPFQKFKIFTFHKSNVFFFKSINDSGHSDLQQLALSRIQCNYSHVCHYYQ